MSGPLAYEWVRISTVRSTWALILVGALVPAALVLFVTWLVNSADDFQGGPPDGGATTGFSGFLPLVAAVLCTIGAASFGQEYRHGLIRITLATYPRRSTVFAAKVIMVVLIVILAAILAIACIVVANALGPAIAGKGVTWDTSALGPPGLRGIIYVVIFVLMAFALTALTRNQPLGIIVPVVMAVLIEPIIQTVALVQEWTWIDWVLPFTGATAGVGGDGLEAWGHLGVFFLWFLVLAIPAWVLFLRRDA